MSDPARRGELLGDMDEKQADVDAALAEYEPFVVSQEAMDAYATARAQFLASNPSQLFPVADAGVHRRPGGCEVQPVESRDDGARLEPLDRVARRQGVRCERREAALTRDREDG